MTVLDRGRRIGGRMATRHLDGRPVDTGAQYFTVTEPPFRDVVTAWQDAGLARPWTDSLTVLDHPVSDEHGPRTTTGPVRWAANQGMRSLVEHLAADLAVEETEASVVERTQDGLRVDGRAASAVVLAMPDPQARRLLGTGLEAVAAALTRDFEPVLALSTWWPERTWDFDGAFVNDHPVISWVADDGRRRGDGAATLVTHSTPEFARPRLEDPQAAAPAFLASLRDLLVLPDAPLGHHLQRWSLARPVGTREAPYALSDHLVGVCGDGWGPVSKVEGAFLSGSALGEALVARLS